MSHFVQQLVNDAQYLLQRFHNRVLDHVFGEYFLNEDIESKLQDEKQASHTFQSVEEILRASHAIERQPSYPCRQKNPTTTRRKFADPFQFHKFLELPFELRLQIWECAIESRYELGLKLAIEVVADQSQFYNNPSIVTLKATSKWDTILPPLLQACRESRTVAQLRFPHTLPSGNQGLLYFDGSNQWIHVKNLELKFAPESFLAFGSISKPLRRHRNYDLPVYFHNIRYLSLDFDSGSILEKLFPGDYLLLLTLFPNLKKVVGLVRKWTRGDVEKDQILDQTLAELEKAFPSFWRKVQRRYLVYGPRSELTKIRLGFVVCGSGVAVA